MRQVASRWLAALALATALVACGSGGDSEEAVDNAQDLSDDNARDLSDDAARDLCAYLHFFASGAVELEIADGAGAAELAETIDGWNPPEVVREDADLSEFFDEYESDVRERVDFYADYPTIGSLVLPDDLRVGPLVESFGRHWAEWGCDGVPGATELPISRDGTPHLGALEPPGDTLITVRVQHACDQVLGALTGEPGRVIDGLTVASDEATDAAARDDAWNELAEQISAIIDVLTAPAFNEARFDTAVDNALDTCEPFLEQYREAD